jgi:hypothetical protein
VPVERLLGVRLHEVDRRGAEEGEQPEAPRQLDPDARRTAVHPHTERSGDARRGALRRPRLREAPGDAGEHQSRADLHRGEQERVVLGVRVADAADVPPDVEAVREAAPRKLGDQREQAESEPREQALVAATTVHGESVTARAAAAQYLGQILRRSGASPRA